MSIIYIYIYNSSGSGGSFQCVVPFLGEFWSHLNKCRRCPLWLDSLRWTCWNICLQEQWQINFEFATHDVDQIRIFNESERSPGIKQTWCEMQQRTIDFSKFCNVQSYSSSSNHESALCPCKSRVSFAMNSCWTFIWWLSRVISPSGSGWLTTKWLTKPMMRRQKNTSKLHEVKEVGVTGNHKKTS